MKYQRGMLSPTVIVGIVLVVIIGCMGFALNRLSNKNDELNKANGKLTTQIQEVTDKNTELNGQIKLNTNLTENINEQSQVHETEIKEMKKETEVIKRKLPVRLPDVKDTKPTPEQVMNSTKRIEVAWEMYCKVSSGDNLCSNEEQPKGEKS